MDRMTTTHDHPGELAADDPIKLLAIRDTPLAMIPRFAPLPCPCPPV